MLYYVSFSRFYRKELIFVHVSFQGIVSPLLLLLFLFLIPRLLHILVRLLGVRSVSEVDLTVIVLFYIFQVG